MLDVPLFHRHILFGALCGGPGQDGSYVDDVKDYTKNEVTDDYNAAFVGCLAKMSTLYGGTTLPNFPTKADLQPEEDKALTEYFCRGWISWEGPNDLDIVFQVNNRSAWPPTVRSAMTANYYVDLSEVFAAGYTVSDVKVGIQHSDAGASITGLKQWAGDVYYFTLDWTGTKIHPGHWDIAEREAVVRLTSPVANGTANDWSYLKINKNCDYDCKTFTGIDENIPVYDNGVLLYGVEPPGGTGTTPAPTIAPTPAPTVVNTPEPTVAGTAVVTPVTTVAPTPAGCAYSLGDANGSGSIDIVDALIVAQYYVGLAPASLQTCAGDVTGDGTIDIVDALRIAQCYVGLISCSF
jgi:hypothetical protein